MRNYPLKSLILFFLLCIVIATGCDKDVLENKKEVYGTYSGLMEHHVNSSQIDSNWQPQTYTLDTTFAATIEVLKIEPDLIEFRADFFQTHSFKENDSNFYKVFTGSHQVETYKIDNDSLFYTRWSYSGVSPTQYSSITDTCRGSKMQ